MLHICESKCFSHLRPAVYAVPSASSLFFCPQEKIGILHLRITVHNTAVCFECFSFSGGGLATSYSREFGRILFKHRQVRCKQKHILPPTGGNFTSAMERQRNETPSQANEMSGFTSKSERSFSEDVKKTFGFK